ncbi:putative Ig domain-containing protein [Deltaproteobacteria bacterium]|nr:putative Ig domain-containing protein [Deltaproteobacteria bacterium]
MGRMRSQSKSIFLCLLMVLMSQVSYIDNPLVVEELDDVVTPMDVDTGNAELLNVGGAHACAVGVSGNMKCWGNGSSGQLGLGNTQNVGDDISEQGEGLPFVSLGTGLTTTTLALGDSHSCALFSNGSIKCWGNAPLLGLGLSTSSDGYGDGYLETGDVLAFIELPSATTATMIETGSRHTCAVLSDNSLICWGRNNMGQLGLGDTDDRGDASNEVGDNFAAVSLPTSRTVSQLALGYDHTCAIWDDGSISCWGGNANGQLGIGSMDDIGDGGSEMGDNLAFVSLPGGNTALNITAGDGFTCAILDTTPTETYCWGINDYGQLGIENTNTIGDGSSEMGNNLVETDLGTSRSAVEIDAGMEHVCAILDNDYVKCWGSGTNGRLGYGNQVSRGTSSGSSNGMGDNLPYVNLGSSSSSVTSYDVDRIEVGSGSTCVIMNDDDVRCWGENSLGQLGYGDTENRGDGASDLPHYTEVDLELDETPASDSCADSFEQAHHSSMDTRLDSSSSDVGDKNGFALLPNGCPAIAYVDDDNNMIRFSAFSNGLWGTESPLSGGITAIDDIDFIIDDSYTPHIVHSLSSGADQLTYTTKANGFWESVALTATATQVEIEIDSSGDVLIAYIDSNDLKTISCSSSCSTSSSWSAADTHSVGAAVENLDSVIDSSDTLHFAMIKEAGSADDLLHVSRSSGGTYASTTIDGSASASSSNASVAIAIGYDSSLHIAYTNVTSIPLYAWCENSCDTLSSWSTEATTGLIGGELDIAISPKGEPWILAQGTSVDLAVSNRNAGTWETQTVANAPGAPQWVSLLIGQTGRVWASLHSPSEDLWVLNDIDYAGSGLQQDADGDGWTGLDEVRCQTDALDSTSTPADFDEDGICDRFDTKNDLPSVGESNVITTGDDFGCAILDDRSVSCWGKNDAEQLGNSAAGVSSNEAVTVDLPNGFEASDIDAGSSHACAVGTDGSVVCWGANDKGQLGIGTTSASGAPSVASLPSGVVALSVSAGSDHTCVATSSGSVYCWGEGGDSQTGNYYTSNPGYYQEDGFESGDFNTLEWVNDATLPWSIDSGSSSTGSNSISVSLLTNQQSDFELSMPTAAGNITFDYKTSTATNHYLRFYIDDVLQNSWSGIAASTFQSVSFDLDAGSHTFKWSSVRSSSAGGQNKVYLDDIRINSSTELISGGTSASPSEVILPASVGVIEDVATGDRHSCALNTIGDVYCWGYNGGSSEMVLGNASTTSTNSSAPVKVDLSATGSHYSSDWDGRTFSGISAGADATCAILSSSLETACWGQGYDDKILGNSTSSIKGTRVDAGSSGDKHYSVSVGNEHACIVVASAIECWGTEVSGELGDGGTASSMASTPVVVSVPAGYTPLEVAVSESSTTSCALFKTSDDSRKIMCWGEGGDGRMGYGSTTDLSAPAADSAVESSGTDILTPDSSSSVSRLLSRPVEIGAGTSFYCARSNQGLVKCWGDNSNGQLGIGSTSSPNNRIGDQANEMGENLAYVNFGANKSAVQISAGNFHACAVLNDASVKCWGRNSEYQLGLGNTTQIGDSTAELGDLMPAVNLGGNAVKVAAGQYHTCALLDTGEVKCWGYGDQGIQGDGSTGTNLAPTTVLLGDYKAVDVSASVGHSCAILENGAAKCWGDNSQYQLGLGNTTDMGDNTAVSDNKMSFLNLADGRTPVKISAGQAYSCALLDSGNIACWGYGSYGRLGYGSSSSVSNPGTSNVDIGTDRAALDVQTSSTGHTSSYWYQNQGTYIHTCAIGDDELLRCWGSGSHGQLGIGSTAQIGDGVNEMGDNLMVADIGDYVESVALGAYSSCAIREDGQVRCWGYNGLGNLGHEDTTQRGDQTGEMGDDLPATELWLRAEDTDSDGTIDLWDTDDDDDGSIDADDDFPLDECADTDTDGDGMPNDIVNSCSTTLIEDLDDDDDNWNDTDEVACATNPLLDTDTPSDFDSDLTCDYLDTDDDNDTFSDIVEGQCEPMYGYSSFNAMSSTSGNYYMRPDYGSAIWFDDEYGLRVIASDGASNGYARVWTYQNAVPDSVGETMRYGGTYGSSQNVGPGANYRYPQVTNHGGLDYLTLSRDTYEMDAQLNTQWSQQQLETGSWYQQPTDVAFSPNGTYYATDSYELDYYDTITDQAGTLNYPTGVSVQYTQIAIDDTGAIHLVALETGSYTYWKYDSGSWSSGETIWSGSNDVYYKEAQLRVNSTNVPYFTFLDAGFIRMFSRTSSWNPVWSSSIPDTNNKGMEMKFDGDDNPHIIWNDFTNASLYHTYMDGSSMRTELVREETSWSASYAYGLSMTFDEQGDVFIFSSNSVSAVGAYIHYKGYFDDPSKDASVTPPDADGDGTCDALDTASLNYSNLVWENGSSNSVVPIYSGLWPDSVSINPALPAGVQMDSSTGVISGTFDQADVAGTTYTISTTSSGDNWQKVFTLRVQEGIPLLTGYEYGPWTTSSYSYGTNAIRSNKIAFAPDGSMYVFGVATGAETFSPLSTPSMQRNNDAYLAKRNGTSGDWEWVEVFDTCDIYAQDLQVSDTGSVFLLAHYLAWGYSPSCTFDFRNSDSFDFTSNNYYDSVVIKYDSLGSPQWVSNSNATAANSGGHVLSSNIEIDSSNGNVTIGGTVKNTTATKTIDFAGVDFTDLETSSYSLPYVARLNPDGTGAWVASSRSNDTSNENIYDYDVEVTSHPDGSATLTFRGRYAMLFGNQELSRNDANNGYQSVVAHLDAGGSWVWVQNVTASESHLYATPTISSFSDGSMLVAFSDGYPDNSIGTLNLMGDESIEPVGDAWFAAVALDNSGNKLWTYFEDDFGIRDYGSDSRMFSVSDSDDVVHLMMDTEDSTNAQYFRAIAFDIDGNIVYQTATSGGSSACYLYDFGLDSYGAPFYVLESNGQYWGGYTTTTEYMTSNTQVMPSSYAYIFRTFSPEILEAHEVEIDFPIAGQYNDLYPMNNPVLDYATSWTISPTLPTGLTFQSSTGRIYGTPSANSSNVTYTINVTLNHGNSELRNSHSFQVTFPVADPAPDVTYDAGDLSPVLERGTLMVAISPTAGLDDQYLSYFTTAPALPSGLSIDSATGDISGTPNVNLSSTDFTIKACNNWGVCDEHTLTLTINEPVAVISYTQAHISLKKEEPMTPLEPSNSGGMVETWEIDPVLPVGMLLDAYGVISGIPVANQDNTTYKIFANNSGGSVDTTVVIQVNGTGMYIFYPYAEHRIAVNSPINTIYPSQRGAAAITWEITPDLPVGMEFGEGNGSIWGTPSELSSETVYSVSAQGIEPEISASTTISITVLLDLDGDGSPDESDDDDDGDGWSDEDELACGGTNSTDANDHPFDSDGDGICDVNDDINDAPVLLFYESSTLEISLNLEMMMFDATAVGGDVTSWSIDPYLPLGLTFSGTSPARDGGDNGSIFGTPTELSSIQSYTITASNDKYSSTFTLNLAVLLDTDLDGLPDRDDSDDDADGWSDQIELLCGKDPLNGTDTPVDTDDDQICDYVDDDDDGDGFIDTEEQQCGSDWKDANEVPVDADGNGVCDGLETDTDGDGWLDGIESSCGTNSTDNSSIPTDIDNDFICDSLDDDKDGDGYANHQDDFPEDEIEWLDTDGDGIGDNADTDDDNDSWTDMWEGLCETDSKSNSSVPDDFDSDMICDLFDDDIDNDGVSNDMDAFEEDANETYDFDADGIGDNADDDDDGDLWLDVDEIACGTDPLNATSTPDNMESCNATKKSEEVVESTSLVTKYWWLCVIFLLLLLLLVPLILFARERGDSVLVMMGMQKGPQPEHTFSSPDFISGSGTKIDPYLLQDIEGLSPGKSASSRESITISHLPPDTIVRFMDLYTEENEGRFDMTDILVEEDDDWINDDDEMDTGSISFKLEFKDLSDSNDGDEYSTLMRVGSSTVYFQWTVSIKDSSGGKKKRKISRKKDTSIEKSKAEAEAKAKKVEAKVEEERRIKAVEDEVRQNAESEAATKLANMELMIAEKMAALEDKMEGLSKKEAELARVAAKSEFIDFNTIGTATAAEKDDLQRTKGIGPFLEEKLNALGIFTFKQISGMTPEIEDQVNVAIEFFSGRVKRDKWVEQAKDFLKED